MSSAIVEGGSVVIAGRDLADDFWSADVTPVEYRKTATVLAIPIDYPAIVRTPEGDMAMEPGDYLVTDNPPTHAWPVRRAVFEATYVPSEPA
jgi:hypothetical protein